MESTTGGHILIMKPGTYTTVLKILFEGFFATITFFLGLVIICNMVWILNSVMKI